MRSGRAIDGRTAPRVAATCRHDAAGARNNPAAVIGEPCFGIGSGDIRMCNDLRETQHGRRTLDLRFACLLSAVILQFAAAPALSQVAWRSGTTARSGKGHTEVLAVLAAPSADQNPRHVVVQFDKPIDAGVRAKLQGAGLRLCAYLGNNAYFAAVRGAGADARALDGQTTLIDELEIQAPWKLSPMLAGQAPPAWALRTPPPGRTGLAGQPWIPALVLFHEDVSPQEALDIAKNHHLEVRSQLRSVNALVAEMPFSELGMLLAEDGIQYIEPALPRLEGDNDSVRASTGANIVQAPPYNLNGSGVTVLVYDAGTARASHVDFQGRLEVRDNSGLIDHATHVAGTIGGAGVANPLYGGMAPGVAIESYGYEQVGGLHQGFLYTDPGDLEANYSEAVTTHGADIANNSIGTNTAYNGFPCDWEGDYGVTDALIDAIVHGSLGAPFRIIWANGNERGGQRCGTTYHTTAPPACAKNHITVGALNSNDDSVTYFTSWGPTDDGRLKPDVSAPGCQIGSDGGVTSCSAAGDFSYTTFCGTSMAAPTVTGLSSLLLQDFRTRNPGKPDPRNAMLKAFLAHTAEDLGNPGPDYQTGYGAVRIQRAVDFVRTASFVEGAVSQGETWRAMVSVRGSDAQLKVTVAWDDVPGTPNVVPALINDLDLVVVGPTGVQHFPWTLGGLADPAAPAVRIQPDHVDNIEQVLVDQPQTGVWTVEIHGFNVPQGPQTFSICLTPTYSPDCNKNGVEDVVDIAGGTSLDCNTDSIPDECQPNTDCNSNGVRDICDIASGTSSDINGNLTPDNCEPDCNQDGVPDDYDISHGLSADCNANASPDECDIAAGHSIDCSGNGIPDECEVDCNGNGVDDGCDIDLGHSFDCNNNRIPDDCELDCNGNGVADECDIASGSSLDLNGNGVPDECSRIYVRANALVEGNGWTWISAHKELAAALAHAANDSNITEIWVSAGRYTPAPPNGDPAAAFSLVSGVRLYGGFAGNEKSLGQRSTVNHETVLSGDLNGNDAPDWGNSGDNCAHVLTGVGLGPSTLLDGFTISGGYAGWGGGAGITLAESVMQITNCRFARNLSAYWNGGAVLAMDSDVTITNSVFDGNYVHLGKGGGVYFGGLSSGSIVGCVFINNTSVGDAPYASEGAGAAIAHSGAGLVAVVNSHFAGNISRGLSTGGYSGGYAGAIDHYGPGPMSIDRCVFTDNQSNNGGAIYSWSDLSISNSVFARNQAPPYLGAANRGGRGGAVGLFSFLGSTVRVCNCTFVGNSADEGGGIDASGAAVLSVANSILWDNFDSRGDAGASQLAGGHARYSCIMNMLTPLPGQNPPSASEFPGCTDNDPSFVDAAGDDFHLAANSTAIDAGDNGAGPNGLYRDLDGRFRYADTPGAPNVGAGLSPLVDMGAYETGPAGDQDFNGDGNVGLFDYTMLDACLTGPDVGLLWPGCDVFDHDSDDDVDLADAAAFQGRFIGEPPPFASPALIKGTILYSGASTGTIHIDGLGAGSTTENFSTTRTSPGAYQLPLSRQGAYNISAYIDVNSNGMRDADESAARYPANPVVISAGGQVVNSINLTLAGNHRIMGRIFWFEDGSGAVAVPLQLTGPAAKAASTDFDAGYYAFADLADGTYRVTPSMTGQYFYPFFRIISLAGSSIAGADFEMHTLPSGDADNEENGDIVGLDVPGYNLTIDTGSQLVTLYIYPGTVFSGDANRLDAIHVGWTATVQYYPGINLASEIDSQAP